MGIFYCFYTGFTRHHQRRWIGHVTMEGEILDCGSPASYLSAVRLVLNTWCSTVLKWCRLLMFEARYQMFSVCVSNISNLYHFDMVLAKDPWCYSCCRSMGSHLSSGWGQPASSYSPCCYMGTFRLQHNEVHTGQCLYFWVLNSVS